MAKTFEVEVKIAPVKGSVTMKTVSVPASATVAEVAKAAGIRDLDKKNITVDGKPAKSDTRVTSDSRISVAPGTKPNVTISERPRGS